MRAGFTTSSIHACNQLNKKILILSPTRRILTETVSRASSKEIDIPGNIECETLKDSVVSYPILAKLPLSLPDCNKCFLYSICKVTEILRNDFESEAKMTYAKLETLMHSAGETAEKIISKISKADVILLDEAHQLSLPSLVKVRYLTHLDIPKGYRALKGIYRYWIKFCDQQKNECLELRKRAEEGYLSQHLSIFVSNSKPLTYKRQKRAWDQLKEMAIKGKMNESDVLAMRDIITILSSSNIIMAYMSDESVGGLIYLMAGENKLHNALNEFLKNFANSATHLFVSGTLFEPHPGYFSELSGKEIENVLFPDIREATKRMTLIPDSWKLNNINFHDKIPTIIEMIKQIAERETHQIYLLAPNRQKALRIKKELEKADIKGIFVDYYRSDLNMGVARTERVCIALGMAETPVNSCDPLAHGETDEERWIDSRKLRKQGVDAATWQAVNRVRDPAGQEDSRIYFIGSRLEAVLQVATWGINRQIAIKGIAERTGSRGENIKTPAFDIQADAQIDLPKINSEGKHEVNPSRRRISDYVKQIELYGESTSISKNPVISSIYINRENDLIFYNSPSNDIEYITTINGIRSAFLNREDCYAVQYFSSTKSKWQYRKEDKSLNDEILKQHIFGQETIGVYQISPDDQVSWCCIDIDSHHGESGTEDKVKTVIRMLQSYGIPFMLEASGSPNSYHIWIFLRQTRTYNAYRFIRQVRSECGINSEVWPKQKTIQSDGSSKYGNPVKVPICVNKKTGGRSVFLNPDTFEPLSGPIKLPGIIELFEVIAPSKAGFGMPKVKGKAMRTGFPQRDYSNDELDYCMKKALEDNLQLIGSEGHHLRLAIVVKAQAIGMDDEEIAQLFQNQNNYDYDISNSKVAETRKYNYLPWSCDTLRDKCGEMVSAYCVGCSMNGS